MVKTQEVTENATIAKKEKRFFDKRKRQVVVKIILLFIAAIFLEWLLEYRHFLNNADDAWNFLINKPLVFFYSSLIMFFVVLLIYGIIRRLFLTIGIASALVLIVGYINISKYNFRGTPLFPEDFQLGSQAGALTKFVDTGDIIKLVIAVILCIILGALLDYITKKWLKNTPVRSNVWWKRYRLISRIAIIAVAIAGFMVFTDFARNHGAERVIKLDFLKSEFIDWDQTKNYADNGFLLGFLYNMNQLETVPPGGYNSEKMSEIRTELEQKKINSDKTRRELSDVNANIVFILNESFYDPKSLTGDVYNISGDDVTPNLHRLQKTNPNGTMFSVDYGGGTANIEYEVMTGLTNYWLKTVPYTNLLPKQKNILSVASFGKENGYETAVLHPFNGGMYKRENVLPKMGFDELMFSEEFTHKNTYGDSEYITDGETYTELFDFLSRDSQKQLVSVITMQNHAPYTAGLYGETIFKATEGLNGEPLTEDEKSSIETYLMTLHKSDEYLGELAAQLESFNEDTVILFYGDHSAGVFPQVIENANKDISDSVRRTPYLILSNFDLDTNNSLPTTTPNCLPNTLFNILNVKKPLNFYLLDEVCSTEPILTDAYFGVEAPFMDTALSQYELLTFDQVAGKQYF